MKKIVLILFTFVLSGCVGQSQISVSMKKALEIIDDSKHPLVVLTKTSPVTLNGIVSVIELHAVGLSDASINLYSDNLCTQMIETKTDPSGEVDFFVNLTAFGTYNFYSKQVRDAVESNCSTVSVSYTYRPASPSILSLVSPASPSTSSAPVLEADSILVGATVNFYSDSSCLIPSFVATASESGFKGTATASLSSPGIYKFYATQVVGGISSACSTSFIDYTYNASAPPDVILTKTSPVLDIGVASSVVLHATGESNAAISLYRDSSCSQLIETKSHASGEVNFTVNLPSFGFYEFYSRQTKNSLDSNCTVVAVEYAYRPPMLTNLALISPASPGTSDAPVLEASNVVAGSIVYFYMDATCSVLSYAGSANESGSKATLTAGPLDPGDYNFYVTQNINDLSSECSTNSISYTYENPTPGEVVLTKTSPVAAIDTIATVVLHAVGESNADIMLYGDNDCSTPIQTLSDVSGEVDFTVNLADYGAYNFYSKQSKNGNDSDCSSIGVTYSYRPPALTALSLVSPTSPGGSDSPVLEAASIETGAIVNFYTDSSCSVPSFKVSVGEYNNKGVIAASLAGAGTYNFYATQIVNDVSSVCSANSIEYTYSTNCTAADIANAPYARGAGTASDPYIICTATQFNEIGLRPADWAKHFELKDDIDYNSAAHNVIGGSSCGVAGFTGVFDGGNHIVSNLVKNAPATDFVGVFGCFNGTLKDITFSNVSIVGQDGVGIIGGAGIDDGLATVATVSNVKVTSGAISGRDKVGGILGIVINGIINNNFTEVTINSSGKFVGGIVGESATYTHIHHNESKSTITAITTATGSFGGIVGKTSNSIIEYNTASGILTGRTKTGGIAGQVAGCLQFNNNSASVTIPAGAFDERGGIVGYGTSCTFSNNQSNSSVQGQKRVGGGFGKIDLVSIVGVSTSGTVISTNDNAGGIVGYVGDGSSINKCFSDVAVTNNYYAVGGLIGYLNTSTLSNCYFNGTVTSSETNSAGAVIGIALGSTVSYTYSTGTSVDKTRGFLGGLSGAASTFNSNYYITPRNFVSAGLAAGQIEEKDQTQLQTLSTFVNWNFNSIWNLNAGSFPNLLASMARSPGTFYISPAGSDNNPGTEALPWKTLAFAGSEAIAGDTMILRGGTYTDTLVINASGTAANKIIFKNYPGEVPVISPSPLPPGDNYGLVDIKNSSFIEIDGLELTGVVINSNTVVPMGVSVSGRGENITLKNLKIYGIENNNANGNAHGILIAGTDLLPLKNITIENNEIYNLKLGFSESLVLNGNVDTFLVKNNIIRDNDNIGIDIIGLEHTCVSCTEENDRARNGIVSFNTIRNITSASNPAYAGDLAAVGIYVDGGKNIIIENNKITSADYGIELATESTTSTLFTENIIVRNNLIYNNLVAGLATGGYTNSRRGCKNCTIVHNTFYKNGTVVASSNGELYFQYNSQDILIANNIFYAGPSGLFINFERTSNTNINLNNNLYFTDAAPAKWTWIWKPAADYKTFAAFAAGAAKEASGIYADPLFTNAALEDFSLQSGSPAKDIGLSLTVDQRGSVDYLGLDRLFGPAPDIGAFERH